MEVALLYFDGCPNYHQNGRRAGDLDDTTDLDEMAAFLTRLLIGVAASVRAEAPPEQLHATSRAVSSILGMHQPTTRRLKISRMT